MWGVFVATYKNAKEAMRINGWSNYSGISSCCTGKERSYKGSLWCYTGKLPIILTKTKPIYQWTTIGEFVEVYRNASVAARAVGCLPGSISDCANGYTSQTKGFMWSYTKVAPTLKINLKIKPVIHINTGTKYCSVTEAAVATNHNIGAISACCNGKRNNIGGDTFCYDLSDQCELTL
jgi:hypothetical protein